MVDDNDLPYLHPTILNSPVHDCIVLGNQAAMEMQESLTTGHSKYDEQSETMFVTNGNSTQCDSGVITNEQCEPNYKSPPSQPLTDGSNYKLPISQDILFPMREEKSLLEIKQVSVRG